VRETPHVSARPPLYGAQQSRFTRYLERREERRPDPVTRELRRRLLAGLRGRVLELGCGDGRAFELYPPTVTSVLAVEPDPSARAVAAERARESGFRIDVVDGVASALPAADAVVDVAVVIWVLCSVPSPSEALRELRRVLVPGGELRFYEHVRSDHVAFSSLQRAADALFWTRALGGCETARDTEAEIRAAGFDILGLSRGFHSSSLLTITSAPYVVGIARS
jgi:ubiquinone/menaquinone biosynthesis C-methylase UbiE